MKPKYIPLVLMSVAAVVAVGYWCMLQFTPVTEEPLVVVEMEYNFLTERLTPVEAGITQEDIETYEAAKEDFSEEEKVNFYANIPTSHTTLDYGGYLDDRISAEEATDLDLLVQLMMADVYSITEGQVTEQMYRAPILTGSSTSVYDVAVDTYYPSRYLTEVLVRDALLSYIYADYAPDREQYFRTGMAMGLYFNSDIENAKLLAQNYLEASLSAGKIATFLPVPPEDLTPVAEELEVDSEMQRQIDEYNTFIRAVADEKIEAGFYEEPVNTNEQ